MHIAATDPWIAAFRRVQARLGQAVGLWGHGAGDGALSPGRLGWPVWGASLAINILGLGLPLVILQVYDRVLPNEARATFALMLVGLAVVLVLEAILRIARAQIVGWSAAQFEHRAATELLGSFLDANPSEIERVPPGVHLDRLQAIDALREYYGGQSRMLLVDLPFLAVFLGLIWVIGGPLVLVPLVMMVLLAAISVAAGRALKVQMERRAEVDERRFSFMIESLAAIQTIKSMAMEPQMLRRYERLQRRGAATSYRAIALGNLVQTAGVAMSSLTMIFIVSAGALMVIGGSISIGALAACTLLGGRTVQPLLRGMSVWTQLQSLEVARERVAGLGAAPATQAHAPARIESFVPEIAFRDVAFGYADAAAPLLDGFSLIVRPGEMLALTAPEGSGKSTLMKLVLGELSPQAGEVTVGGYAADGPRRDDLALDIAYVPATATLFSGTILENLTMFQEGEAIDRARAAARLIGLEEDIHRLPEGYDTQVSRGVAEELPGGMQQRIVIARAFARNAKIILFDEANAGLDRRADARLLEALAALKGKATVIAVSHRPSLIRLADRVVGIHKGRARLRHDFARAEPHIAALPEAGQDAAASAHLSAGAGGAT